MENEGEQGFARSMPFGSQRIVSTRSHCLGSLLAHAIDGLSPLHVAVRLKDDTSIYLLLEYGARIRAKDRAGKMLVDESPALGRPYLLPRRPHVRI